jgi:hypothetical protein
MTAHGKSIRNSTTRKVKQKLQNLKSAMDCSIDSIYNCGSCECSHGLVQLQQLGGDRYYRRFFIHELQESKRDKSKIGRSGKEIS